MYQTNAKAANDTDTTEVPVFGHINYFVQSPIGSSGHSIYIPNADAQSHAGTSDRATRYEHQVYMYVRVGTTACRGLSVPVPRYC